MFERNPETTFSVENFKKMQIPRYKFKTKNVHSKETKLCLWLEAKIKVYIMKFWAENLMVVVVVVIVTVLEVE